MSQYSATLSQDGQIKPEIKEFFERFYEISDQPSGHEQYADMFTKDAKLIMASNAVTGRDEIIKMRLGMWEKVAKRSHRPQQVYAFGSASDDVMLYGTVDYQLKAGGNAKVDWAARAHFTTVDGALKMDFYQVYLDTAAASRVQ